MPLHDDGTPLIHSGKEAASLVVLDTLTNKPKVRENHQFFLGLISPRAPSGLFLHSNSALVLNVSWMGIQILSGSKSCWVYEHYNIDCALVLMARNRTLSLSSFPAKWQFKYATPSNHLIPKFNISITENQYSPQLSSRWFLYTFHSCNSSWDGSKWFARCASRDFR